MRSDKWLQVYAAVAITIVRLARRSGRNQKDLTRDYAGVVAAVNTVRGARMITCGSVNRSSKPRTA